MKERKGVFVERRKKEEVRAIYKRREVPDIGASRKREGQ